MHTRQTTRSTDKLIIQLQLVYRASGDLTSGLLTQILSYILSIGDVYCKRILYICVCIYIIYYAYELVLQLLATRSQQYYQSSTSYSSRVVYYCSNSRGKYYYQSTTSYYQSTPSTTVRARSGCILSSETLICAKPLSMPHVNPAASMRHSCFSDMPLQPPIHLRARMHTTHTREYA